MRAASTMHTPAPAGIIFALLPQRVGPGMERLGIDRDRLRAGHAGDAQIFHMTWCVTPGRAVMVSCRTARRRWTAQPLARPDPLAGGADRARHERARHFRRGWPCVIQGRSQHLLHGPAYRPPRCGPGAVRPTMTACRRTTPQGILRNFIREDAWHRFGALRRQCAVGAGTSI